MSDLLRNSVSQRFSSEQDEGKERAAGVRGAVAVSRRGDGARHAAAAAQGRRQAGARRRRGRRGRVRRRGGRPLAGRRAAAAGPQPAGADASAARAAAHDAGARPGRTRRSRRRRAGRRRAAAGAGGGRRRPRRREPAAVRRAARPRRQEEPARDDADAVPLQDLPHGSEAEPAEGGGEGGALSDADAHVDGAAPTPQRASAAVCRRFRRSNPTLSAVALKLSCLQLFCCSRF